MKVTPQKIVLKFGTGILTREQSDVLDGEQLEKLVAAVARLIDAGHQCVVVSSGAVGAGLKALGYTQRPALLSELQACASVGQTLLMHYYESLFRQYQIRVGQLLLTHDDLHLPERKKNVGNTLEHLLAHERVVPIINENDSVAVEELRFGDNDVLSAEVAQLVGADILLILTSVDGLEERANGEAKLIERVTDIDAVIQHVEEEKGALSVGGMGTKLEAVRTVIHSGIEAVILNGRHPERIAEVVAGGGVGTRFFARVDRRE